MALGAVFGLGVAMYTGVLLWSAHSIPLWNTPLIPVLFTVSALDAGASVILAALLFEKSDRASLFIKRVSIALVVLIVLEACTLAALFSLHLGGSMSQVLSANTLLKGDLSIQFWVLVVIVGLAIPFVLTVLELAHVVRKPELSRLMHFGAAACALAGGFTLRFGSKLSELVAMIGESDLDQVTQDVRSEFCALFLNMSAHPVFTSESVYLSGNHMIMQEQRSQVVDIYSAHHLSVDNTSFDWPEDHISMEMLFMAHLCQLESNACRSLIDKEAGDDLALAVSRLDSVAAAQKAFFTEHLDQWVPLFVEELSRYAETLFYQGVAEYLGEFLDGERELLNEF